MTAAQIKNDRTDGTVPSEKKNKPQSTINTEVRIRNAFITRSKFFFILLLYQKSVKSFLNHQISFLTTHISKELAFSFGCNGSLGKNLHKSSFLSKEEPSA